MLRAGERHWELFRQLASDVDARGNDIADAYLAAYSVENNATWLSADRGFSRFHRLRWRHPLDPYGVHHGRSGRLPSRPCESSLTAKTWCS
jgi:uncharacterized protein